MYESQSEIDEVGQDEEEEKEEPQSGLRWVTTEILPNTEQAMIKKQKLQEEQRRKDKEML